MALNERSKFATTLHTIVALLLLLGGGALVGVGIWSLASEKSGNFDLDYSGSSFWKWVLHYGIAAIIAGSFLLLSALVALIALSRRCLGKVFRVVYILMALVILAVLLFISIVSLLIVTRRDRESIEDFVRDAWKISIKSEDENVRNEVCKIQERWDCVGFSDGDCTGCVLGTESGCSENVDGGFGTKSEFCPQCGDVKRDPNKGCFPEIRDTLKKVYLPLGIVTAVLAAIVLLDIFVVCCI
eukprot:Plantae.Rhodophyta-Hildenbrandia_rubra.ctg7924.p1 GENE.Plantae.Rhodophyta-Hildenbrandia_rubra.ctg7924~~Plantae.Rhodophyta-Hildenbrandia_rubra.ctg7924.p1  ORF type:complete len:242 (+),score=35.45 Plantae.Rhodophyta-Hildenbrandia_rubra.ctg7924:479-1204(+)